ncbi:MAG: flagellar hook-basal body protein [Oscillospiraceae bacterium]|nr:flagellar hook-basal body protein [Oscillospiraceae bacterium]
MFKGFYNLTSGMLTHQRNLNVVSNNMTNISTAGYKSGRYTSTTFGETIYSLVGNKDKNYREIGEQSYIRATQEITTDYTQGAMEPTDISLDFAIDGDGFFAMRNTEGEILYTRAGSFSLDDEGYLVFSGFGRILDNNMQEIRLMTDKIQGDRYGNITLKETGTFMGKLGVFTFDDLDALEYNEEGIFIGENAQLIETPLVRWGMLERSNVDMVNQMTEMLTAQRAFQSAAQATMIYDKLITQAVTEIGKL